MSVSQVADSVPVATLPVSDMVPSVQFADSPAGAGVASFTSVCPSSQQEKVNQETDFENEMKLQKLDDQFIQLLNEVTMQSIFLSDLFKETRLRKGKQTLRAGRPTSSGAFVARGPRVRERRGRACRSVSPAVGSAWPSSVHPASRSSRSGLLRAARIRKRASSPAWGSSGHRFCKRVSVSFSLLPRRLRVALSL